ncbi:hypothetical protein ENSA5_47840 [Enhygromyxa salina]|uniref:Uncharacterized protein n=1 Tax=Enhygromyxa salina TaxID=215803 RepID=A0A2S9XID0_9BACT|nr:hypothetical protein [Enhygromyxa salina]PRP92603.1 hypothetical protein ENSA5_47840 [Enhygromyxa salina]
MNEAKHQPRGVPRRVILLIAFGALIPFVVAGVLLWTTFAGNTEPSLPVVADYLRAPETVPERVEAISDQVRRIQISPGGIEAYDAEGQRYSIQADGTHLRRGDAVPVPSQSFAVAEVDFSALPGILAAATERSGGTPNRATVEFIDGDLAWRILVWSEVGSNELVYDFDGQLRVGANAR